MYLIRLSCEKWQFESRWHNTFSESGCVILRPYLDSPICLLIVSHCEQLSPRARFNGGYVYRTVWKQICARTNSRPVQNTALIKRPVWPVRRRETDTGGQIDWKISVQWKMWADGGARENGDHQDSSAVQLLIHIIYWNCTLIHQPGTTWLVCVPVSISIPPHSTHTALDLIGRGVYEECYPQ